VSRLLDAEVMSSLWPNEQKSVRGLGRSWPMQDPRWNDTHVTGAHFDAHAVLEVEPKGAFPAQKELVLIVTVPVEVPVQSN
jgi:hypothetical protein